MKLFALDGRLYRREPDGALHRVETVAEADGVMFLCPACYARNGGEVGTHSILVWIAGRAVPAEERPLPRWDASGTKIDDLTLSPSINLHPGREPCPERLRRVARLGARRHRRRRLAPAVDRPHWRRQRQPNWWRLVVADSGCKRTVSACAAIRLWQISHVLT